MERKTVRRDFDSSPNNPGSCGSLHVTVWIEPQDVTQIELWTDRGKSVVLQGEDIDRFLSFWKGF